MTQNIVIYRTRKQILISVIYEVEEFFYDELWLHEIQTAFSAENS